MHFSLLGLLKNLEGITIDDATCFTSCGSHLFLDNEGNVYLCGTYSLLEEPQNEGFVMNINEDFSKFEEIVGVQRAKIKPCLSVFEKKTKDYDDSPSEIDNVSFANQVKLMGCFVSGLNMLLDMSKKDPQLRKSLFSIPHINKMRKRIKTSV